MTAEALASGNITQVVGPAVDVEFPAGQSERKLTIEQPGVVEVEEHDSGKVLLQLQVS